MDSQLKRAGKRPLLFSKSLRCVHLVFEPELNNTKPSTMISIRRFYAQTQPKEKRQEARDRSLFAPFSDAMLNTYCVPDKTLVMLKWFWGLLATISFARPWAVRMVFCTLQKKPYNYHFI